MVKELLVGAVLGITGAAAMLYVGIEMGWLVVVSDTPSLMSALNWLYDNLRLSLIPFSLVAFCFAFHILQLKNMLKQPSESIDSHRVSQLEHYVDIWVGVFFGIGVIWTAIGMRSALIESLSGLDAQSAAAAGAFTILQRMVDGGILLALSTTIFGGVGGYAMRVIKAFYIGHGLQQYRHQLAQQYYTEQLTLLRDIRERLPQPVEQDKTNGAVSC